MRTFDTLGKKKVVIGMVHLLPLLGTPFYQEGTMTQTLEKAVADATALYRGGADGCLIQTVDRVYPAADEADYARVAAMAMIAKAVADATGPEFQIGIQIMLNALKASVAVAYVFKHALVQEEAYQSLLKSTRQYHHQRIAQMLEERFPETVATEPELLAHHYTEAGLQAQAIPYWQQAAQPALQRSANVQAIQHLSTGLTLLKTFPDTPERAQQELVIQASLGPGADPARLGAGGTGPASRGARPHAARPSRLAGVAAQAPLGHAAS